MNRLERGTGKIALVEDDLSHRGRLLTARQVTTKVFEGSVSAEWVRRNVPGKITLGHSTVRWYENDVRAWIDSRKED